MRVANRARGCCSGGEILPHQCCTQDEPAPAKKAGWAQVLKQEPKAKSGEDSSNDAAAAPPAEKADAVKKADTKADPKEAPAAATKEPQGDVSNAPSNSSKSEQKDAKEDKAAGGSASGEPASSNDGGERTSGEEKSKVRNHVCPWVRSGNPFACRGGQSLRGAGAAREQLTQIANVVGSFCLRFQLSTGGQAGQARVEKGAHGLVGWVPGLEPRKRPRLACNRAHL